MRPPRQMLLPRQFRLDAFEQPTAHTFQRATYTLSKSLRPPGDVDNAKVFDVTQLQQFLVLGRKLFPTVPQGNQIDFCINVIEPGIAFGENMVQFPCNTGRRRLRCHEIADLVFCDLTRPGEEVAAGLKRIELAPQDQTHRLIEIVGVCPIPDNRVDIAVELPLVACDQLNEQIVAILLVHPRMPFANFLEVGDTAGRVTRSQLAF
jgi:hypothetical protein